MKKYLFTDGTSEIKEAQCNEELETFIAASSNPAAIRIWCFNSSEWISYAAFRKIFPPAIRKEATIVEGTPDLPVKNYSNKRWLRKFLFAGVTIAGAFLVFNFTRIKWGKASPVNFIASRPANVPVMDIDSLIEEIEYDRNDLLDRNTKTNLRLRNTWPDRVELKLNSERETNGAVSRYFNIDVSIDNTTGFNLDAAVVRLNVWKDGKIKETDTLLFNNIRYDKISARQLSSSYRGDSIAVSFELIKAKAFNFCYSSSIKNNSGNYNDRWFCRGE